LKRFRRTPLKTKGRNPGRVAALKRNLSKPWVRK
jgi:hypothetical protein